MEKALEILQHMEKLYAKDYNENYAAELSDKNPDMVSAWAEAFRAYDLVDVLAAIDDFWQFKNSKSRPNVAQITAILTAKKVDTTDNSVAGMRARILKCADELGDKWGREARDKYLKLARQQWPDVNLSGHEWTEPEIPAAEKNAAGGYAEAYMRRDIKPNRCRHLLPVYQATVRYIAEDLLLREIPVEQWRRLTFAQRCEIAIKKGLFNDFDNLLTAVCRRDWGKDYQFDAESASRPFSVSRAINRLGAHFSAQDDSNDNFDLGDVI